MKTQRTKDAVQKHREARNEWSRLGQELVAARSRLDAAAEAMNKASAEMLEALQSEVKDNDDVSPFRERANG